ncbi:MAG: AI-2E family transporter [Parvularculaceae bacterium]
MEVSGISRLFFVLATLALILHIAHIGAGVLVPLVIAAFLSFLIVTFKNLICEIPVIGKKLPGWLGFLIAFLAIAIGFFLLVQIIRSNVAALIADAPEYQRKLIALLDRVQALAPPGVIDDSLWQELRRNIRIGGVLSEVAEPLRRLAASAFTIFLYTGFLLAERGSFAKKIAAATASPDRTKSVNEMIDDISFRIRQYLSIKTFTSALTAILSYVVLLMIGVDYASFWAVLIFVLNFIPIIGSIVAVAFPVLLTIVQFGSLSTFLIALAALTGVQQLVGSIIEPRLLGASLNLSPLVILLSLAIWGAIWGVAGMLLCVPIMVAAMIVLAQFDSTRAIAVFLSSNGEVGQAAAPKKPLA